MKNRVFWMVAPAVALGLSACGKKEEPKAPEPAKAPVAVEAPAQAPPPPPAPVVKPTAISADERAAKLGFVKHLPQDTEVVMTFHNGSKSADRIKSSKLWKLIQSEMGIESMDEGDDADTKEKSDDQAAKPEGDDTTAAAKELPAGDEPTGPAALFGNEFTIALGKSSAEQTGNLLTFYRRRSYFQLRTLTKALVESVKSGDGPSLETLITATTGTESIKNLLADPQSGIALFEKMKMPPIYLAFRTKEAERAGAAQQITSLLENLTMVGEMVEPMEIEKDGIKFTGHKISGAKLAEQLKDERTTIEEMSDAATADKLLAAIAKKDLVILTGTLGDYVTLFFGSSADDMTFAKDTATSLAASEALSFADTYLAKDLAAVIYGQKDTLDTLIATAGGLADMTSGISDGLAGTDGLGDTRDLETLLRMVGERETALRKFSSTDTLGLTAFFENGFKIETQGGTDAGALDWKSPNQLASLGDAENVALFANMTKDAAYDQAANAYIEALLETTYAAAIKISEIKVDSEKMDQFKQAAKLFDTKFRTDTVALWDAIRGDFAHSLGGESAIILDLSGSMPAIPGIPQPIVDNAKFPRATVIAPVTDRSKLAGSWQKMNSSMSNLLKNASELTGQDIPMQKPISSEKDGLTTWFFSMPFFNDDFLPSVTVGDKWFAASTSKNQALDLIQKADKGGETRTGAWIHVNFNTLRTFADETTKVLDQNKDSLGIKGEDLDKAAKYIKACADMDQLNIHIRREDGKLRSSVHFKTH